MGGILLVYVTRIRARSARYFNCINHSYFTSSNRTLLQLYQPMILQEVIKSIVSFETIQERPRHTGTLYVVFMLMSTIITMQVNRTMGRVGAKIRGGFTAMIYSKGLRLTSAARAAVGEGKIVSLMEVDCAKLEWGLWTCMNVYQLILLLVGAIILLWILAGMYLFVAFFSYSTHTHTHTHTNTGVSSLASLIVMVILFIPSAWAMSNAIPHWPKTMALKDRRVRLLTELLQSMKLTKALGWEGAMLDRVQRQRKDEATEIHARELVLRVVEYRHVVTDIYQSRYIGLVCRIYGGKR